MTSWTVRPSGPTGWCWILPPDDPRVRQEHLEPKELTGDPSCSGIGSMGRALLEHVFTSRPAP